MTYNEVEGYYETLNLILELFEKVGLPKYHSDRIHNLAEIVESNYNGILLNKFCRNDDEIISEEEFCRGMILDQFGNLALDYEGCSIPNPNYSVLAQAKTRTFLKLVNQS